MKLTVSLPQTSLMAKAVVLGLANVFDIFGIHLSIFSFACPSPAFGVISVVAFPPPVFGPLFISVPQMPPS